MKISTLNDDIIVCQRWISPKYANLHCIIRYIDRNAQEKLTQFPICILRANIYYFRSLFSFLLLLEIYISVVYLLLFYISKIVLEDIYKGLN